MELIFPANMKTPQYVFNGQNWREERLERYLGVSIVFFFQRKGRRIEGLCPVEKDKPFYSVHSWHKWKNKYG